MATLRTEITEIVTGLALLGYRDLDHALSVRPRSIEHVADEHFDRLVDALAGGRHDDDFSTAWDNGWRFARSTDGLRGRPPWRVEWKGAHRPPSYEQIPADLRVDHVYLISCKYGSNILLNASPSHLFDRALAERRVERVDWFAEVAPEALDELYRHCRRGFGLDGRLPEQVGSLTAPQRVILKDAFGGSRSWPDGGAELYSAFAYQVAHASAERWRRHLVDARSREAMLWRLLRLQAAPYFVLGASATGDPLHYRVGTPWDFRQRFSIVAFDAWADPAGQPIVRWRADVAGGDGDPGVVEGHVEVRWSHGRFAGVPEAKVYLDTPHHHVPGYVPLGRVDLGVTPAATGSRAPGRLSR